VRKRFWFPENPHISPDRFGFNHASNYQQIV